MVEVPERQSNKTGRKAVAGWICLALLLRLLTWAIDPSGEPREDARQYHALAWNLVSHGVYSTDSEPPLRTSARRTPGYPLFLAAVYGVRGVADYRLAELVEVFLGAALCGAGYVLVLQITPDRRAAVAVAALTAMVPPLILFSSRIALEAVFPLLLIAGAYANYRWLDESSTPWLWVVVSGLIWGTLALVKPEAALLAIAVAPIVCFLSRSRQQGFVQALVGVAIAAAVITPWIVRNHLLIGKASLQFGRPDEGGGDGVGYLRGYRLRAENGFTFWPKRYTYLYGDEWAQREDEYQAVIDGPVKDPDESDVAFWLKRPHLVIKYSLIRFVGLMKPQSWSSTFGLDRDFSQLSGGTGRILLGAKAGLLLLDVSVLAFCGIGFLYSLHPNNKRLWIITATILYFLAVYSLLHGIARYRVPLLPLGLMLGCVWFSTVWARRKAPVPSEVPANETAAAIT